jgi:signal transduction histidine kinase
VRLPRLTVRARLTALYAGVFTVATAAVLGVSFWLVSGHLHRTLDPGVASDTLTKLAEQYGLALAGIALLAVALGWAAAGRVLAPLKTITATARRVSDERLDERISLHGPRDELRELADTFDAMLDRLGEAMEAERRFVANASHELRSPLTVIRTEAEVTLADPHATVEDLREMGGVVLRATERTEALLDGLLVLARSQRGLLRRETLDLSVAAHRAAAEVAPAASEAGVRLRVEAEPTAVRGDEPLLVRLVGNLLDNAVRYNEPGGWVELHTAPAGEEEARIRVVNSGRHIPEEAVERLGRPFERLARHGEVEGSGLGLSIVRAVCEAHGGTLRIAARPAGGLDVTVALPAAQKELASAGGRARQQSVP